jgi:hypothetical protein
MAAWISRISVCGPKTLEHYNADTVIPRKLHCVVCSVDKCHCWSNYFFGDATTVDPYIHILHEDFLQFLKGMDNNFGETFSQQDWAWPYVFRKYE